MFGFRAARGRLLLVCALLAAALPVRLAAEDAPDDILVVVPKLKKRIEQLKANLSQLENRRKTVELPGPGPAPVDAPPAEPEAVPVSPQPEAEAVRWGDDSSRIASAELDHAQNLVAEAEEPATTPERRHELVVEASRALDAGEMARSSLKLNVAALDELKQRAAIMSAAAAAALPEPASGGAAAAYGDEKGGGVFLDQPAEVPIDRRSVSSAEYDLASGRFTIRAKGRVLTFPPMDRDLTAVVLKCLYGDDQRRNLIATSLDIDPVNMGRKLNNPKGGYKVLLGCDALWDTEAGRILIDADELVLMLWMGKNRLGEDMTRPLGYHSLAQLTLDHPLTQDIIAGKPRGSWRLDMRNWIRPKAVLARRAGSELRLDDVPFEFLTETVNLDSPDVFAGEPFPNPGASAFAAYFTEHFDKFVHITLETEEQDDDGSAGGPPVRPLEDLRELAKIVGVALWIKGSAGQTPIPMDVSWAMGYEPAVALTRHSHPRIALHDVEREITPPIVIYNQYGESRLIDAEGRTTRIVRDASGKFLEAVPER